jgi:2-polyprenyl-3-methyl-5-hydroxy-6-metoxy-1,4-benzoquinol methylase
MYLSFSPETEITKMKSLENHYEFGKNWSAFVKNINELNIIKAEQSLLKLVGPKELEDKSFLDIGCGSGLHSLAALRQGAKKVLAVDIDPVSVATARSVLSQYHEEMNWECKENSVFELDSDSLGKFDIVYSWGVLHHTGDLMGAIPKALDMVAENGSFVIAVYRKTRLCAFWKIEKKVFNKANPTIRNIIRSAYISFYRIGRFLQKRSFKDEVHNYNDQRGMSFYIDVDDWLGGYPYESIAPQVLKNYIQGFGFKSVKEFSGKSGFGFFGSGNDEFIFQKQG